MQNSLEGLLHRLLMMVSNPFLSDRVVVRAGRYGGLGPDSQRLLQTLRRDIDIDAFVGIQRRHADAAREIHGKYLDLDTWLSRHLTHAEALGLFAGPPRRILDIGTGNGYFPWICSRLGHDVVATDVDTMPLYDDLVAFLGIRRVVHAVETLRPLPDFGGRFDLVTAFNTVFDRIDETRTWTPREWGFFLEDLRTHVLASNAEIVLKLNPNRQRFHDKSALAAYFRSRGADVDLPFVHLRVAGGAFVPVRKGCLVPAAAAA